MLMGLLQKSRHPSRLFAAKTLQAHTTGQALTWAFHYLPLIFTSALELHFPDDNIEANALQATCPELELGEWSSSSIWDPTLSWIALKLYRNIPLSRSFHNLQIPNSSIRTHSSFSWLCLALPPGVRSLPSEESGGGCDTCSVAAFHFPPLDQGWPGFSWDQILSHLLLSYLAPGSPVKGVSRSSFLQLATSIWNPASGSASGNLT